MTAFVGRRGDLADLQSELSRVRETAAGRFLWVRGRRRVGKSRLIQEFCDRSGPRYCFYQAQQLSRLEALADYAAAARESTLAAKEAFDGAVFESWTAALRESVREATPDDPAVLVIDELPYLTERDPNFAADLQRAWDRSLERAPVLLICIGSDVRMMESLLAARSPLYGRPSRELKIDPLNPRDVAEITSAPSASDAFDRYLIVGGVPPLAASWSPSKGVREFLSGALANDQTPFATTALRIMASEFQNELQAGRVIKTIGHGDSAYSRIQSRSGVKGNTLTDALTVLVENKRLVEKALPYAAPPGKTAAKYSVTDPYLRFWLRFVGPNMPELARGRSDLVVERIMRDWSAYRGRAIEPLARVAIERLLPGGLGERLGDARHVGAWWRRDHAVEVDLVGGDRPEPGTIGFVGSVKWRERGRFSAEDLAQLARQRTQVPGAESAKLVAVSRTGFEKGLGADASFGPEELLGAWETGAVAVVSDNGRD